MAHFPASLSMSRLAGSSGTQKVCETTKSKDRTEAGAGAKVARPTRPPTRRHHFTVSLCAWRPKCQDDQVQTLRTVADARAQLRLSVGQRIRLCCLGGLGRPGSSQHQASVDRFVGHAAQNDIYLLPKELDEKVVELHFPALHSPYSGTSRLHRHQG